MENDSLRKVQIIEADLLRKLKQICEREELKYYLLGGTLIGALRHKGFIPWDDDIDVGMPRPDYEVFINRASKYLTQEEQLLHYSVDRDYQDYPAKLINSRTFYLVQRENDIVKQNIWIDIFPIDGTPEKRLIHWLHMRKLNYYMMLRTFCFIDSLRKDENRPLWKDCIFKFAKIVPVGNNIDALIVNSKIDTHLKKYCVMTSNVIGNHVGAYKEREFVPKEYFGEGSIVEFEGEQYCAPKEADKYLSQIYGDYMRLPPENQRVSRHHVIDIIYLS